MMENRGAEPLDPTPNYDCHMSKQATNVDNSWSQQLAYESTQVNVKVTAAGLRVYAGKGQGHSSWITSLHR